MPLIWPRFHGTDQAIVCLTIAAAVLNSTVCVWISLKKSVRLQEAQAAMLAASQAKSEFLARMSHEIRTPLNGVLGMALALAAETDLKPGHRQSLAVIRQSGESLLTILNDVLDPSKVEAGLSRIEAQISILAAEDNTVNQLVLKTLLAQVGVEPTLVGDGLQALDAWRHGAFDLILMDVQMPVMDGLAATLAIRAAETADPGRGRIPILALTANAMQHQVAEYLAAGFDGHVAKPIDAAKLYAAIAAAAQIIDDAEAKAA